jgi:hypothetical protein
MCFGLTRPSSDNCCGAAVSIGEQLPEYGFVRPKHVAI